jgi:hypothetical protein
MTLICSVDTTRLRTPGLLKNFGYTIGALPSGEARLLSSKPPERL